MLRLLFHVGRAVANQGLGQILQAIADPTLGKAGDLLGRIAFDAWDGLRRERRQDQLNADILEAARMDAEEIRRQAAEIAAAVAPDDAELQGHVERFVTLIPASIRATLRRTDDPSGTTLPFNYAVEDESDLVKLLPVRFPRPQLKPGYAPPFLRGWELVEQLGAGGFGEVWKARNPEADQLVGAVKFGHALSDAELALLNEGDVLNRLLAAGRHDGIVALQDCSLRRTSDPEHVPWLRYEFVPGGDLTGLIRRWQGLPMGERVPQVLAAFRELCQTVGHFHRLTPSPIVHRDLKPSNILVAAGGKLKVGDFGIGSISSRRTLDGERHGTLSRTNTVQAYLRGAYTPLYAPPEQRFDPKHKARPTDDIHALGVILFQMLTGKLDAAPGVRFDRQLPGVPKELIDLVGDCVDPVPENRPADAVAERLRPAPSLPSSSPLTPAPPRKAPDEHSDPSPSTPPTPLVPPPSRAVMVGWATLGGLLLGTLAALVMYHKNGLENHSAPLFARLVLLFGAGAVVLNRDWLAELASALSLPRLIGVAVATVVANHLADLLLGQRSRADTDALDASLVATPLGIALGCCVERFGLRDRLARLSRRSVIWGAIVLSELLLLAFVFPHVSSPASALLLVLVAGGIVAFGVSADRRMRQEKPGPPG